MSTHDASLKLGISERRVRALILNGRLPAQMIGKTYVVQEKDLKLVRLRKNGRPPGSKKKAAAEGEVTQ